MSKELTEKQSKIISFISSYIDKYTYPPSYDEIAKHFKMKKPSVFDHLNAIEKKGYIKRKTYRARTIVIQSNKQSADALTEKFPVVKEDYISIPILGKIAAGSPMLAIENIEGSLTLDRSLIKNMNSFALRVKGDSMIDAGIKDGDLVIIKMQPVAENNEIAAVLIDDEVTLKYYEANADVIRLIPANKHYKPIIIRRGTKEVRILGKATGLYRTF
jgi:repressor LexA